MPAQRQVVAFFCAAQAQVREPISLHYRQIAHWLFNLEHFHNDCLER
jgi:hypothetical protein